MNAELPFELDVVFESGSKEDTDEELVGEVYGKELQSRIKGFQVEALKWSFESFYARLEIYKYVEENYISVRSFTPLSDSECLKSEHHHYSNDLLISNLKVANQIQLMRNVPQLPSQDHFERTFELRGKGYDEDMVRFAQSAMSNMVGGIG